MSHGLPASDMGVYRDGLAREYRVVVSEIPDLASERDQLLAALAELDELIRNKEDYAKELKSEFYLLGGDPGDLYL